MSVKRTIFLAVLLFPFLAAFVYSGVLTRPTPDSNLLGERLTGVWHLAPGLNERLTASPAGAPAEVVIMAAPSSSSIPAEVEEAVGSSPIFLAGTLSFGPSQFSFLLAGKEGSARLVCYQTPAEGGKVAVLSILFALIPARERRNDLLFLGGEDSSQPFFAYERAQPAAEETLSGETRRLLQQALSHSYSPELEESLLRLPSQPDWQAAVDSILADFRAEPEGEHNNRLIVLSALVAQHLPEIRLDLDPLIAVLASHRWTNQQKAADLLAQAVRRRDLFMGKERQVCRALIPLTASQRGPVVEPALRVLQALSGNGRLQRDPAGWAAWFERTYGERLPPEGWVYELVTTLEAKGRDSAGEALYSVNGGAPIESGRLKRELGALVQEAARQGLRPSFVALVPGEITSAATQAQALQRAAPIRKILESLGFESFTVAPVGSSFYGPFRPGYPLRP